MNTTLKNVHELGQSIFVGLRKQATQTASRSTRQWDDGEGSYGRGSYAGHIIANLDFGAAGSFAGGA